MNRDRLVFGLSGLVAALLIGVFLTNQFRRHNPTHPIATTKLTNHRSTLLTSASAGSDRASLNSRSLAVVNPTSQSTSVRPSVIGSMTMEGVNTSSSASLADLLQQLKSSEQIDKISVRQQLAALTASPETKTIFSDLVRAGGEDAIAGVQPLMRMGTAGVQELMSVIDSVIYEQDIFDRLTTEAGFDLSDENRTLLNQLALEQDSDTAREILRKADLIESEQIYGEPDF